MEPTGKKIERRHNIFPPFGISHASHKSSFFSQLVEHHPFRNHSNTHQNTQIYACRAMTLFIFSASKKAIFLPSIYMFFVPDWPQINIHFDFHQIVKAQCQNRFFSLCNHNHLITVDWSVYLAYLWLFSYACMRDMLYIQNVASFWQMSVWEIERIGRIPLHSFFANGWFFLCCCYWMLIWFVKWKI